MKESELFEVDLGNRKVHLIKFQRKSAQGRHKHTNKDGKNIHKTQAGRANTKWSIPDLATRLSSGLWKMRTNPYYTGEGGESKPLPNSDWNEKGVDKMKYISWQEFFEISHYKTPGYYSSERASLHHMAANRQFRPTALQSFRYNLVDGTNMLDLSKPKHQLMYFFALNCKDAFLKDKNDRKRFPRALFYLQEVDAPAEEEYLSNIEFDSAIVNLVELKDKSAPEILRQMAVILNVGTANLSASSCYNALRDFIMGDMVRGSAKTNTTRFNEAYKILKKKGGRARFDTMYKLQEMINQRVVLIENMTYIWSEKRGTDMEVLGKTREQVIASLMDEGNAHILQMLDGELSKKMLK